MKALTEISDSSSVSFVSVYDNHADERYVAAKSFIGFNKSRTRSVIHIIRNIYRQEVLILGHINLAIAGVIYKILRPSCKLVVIAHGIELWNKQKGIKRKCLNKADVILAVSTYTKNQLVFRNNIAPQKIRLIFNCIDPYFRIPATIIKPQYLLDRYKIFPDQPVVFTLSRISSAEQYKGYDRVIAALAQVLKKIPGCIYILAGKYDEDERNRIEKLIDLHNVNNNVIISGYINDAEVTDHYLLADVFIMPSKNEGFGIVFLEALACGVPAIGGNQDGTADALLHGKLGTLIDPDDIFEISSTILKVLASTHNKKQLQHNVMNHFSFERYKERLATSLIDYAN